jgi:uncharacterized protein (DUF1684 family)
MMLILLTLSAWLQAAPPAAAYHAQIEQYRAARTAELVSDEGWLTVAGLFWLKQGSNIAGSAAGSDLVLPKKAPARLGVFELKGRHVIFTADSGAKVTRNGKPVTRTALADGEEGALASGDLRLFVIRREDRVGIRMRDLRSRMREAFKGLEYYPIDPTYRVIANFTAHATPRKIPIMNVLGQTPEMSSPGYVTFELHGKRLRLEPVYETDERKDLFFIFKDLTSRDKTYGAGRYLHAALPQNGRVVLDFNKAYNPPCAFTDFATCPLPPKQNQLSVRIEAGELAYHGPTK